MGSWRTGLMAGVLALFAGAGPLRAEDCGKAASQTDMNICADANFRAADAALNAAYGDLAREPSLSDRLDALRAAERSWVAYRDGECAFEGALTQGGSMHGMVVLNCEEKLTKRRTADLRAALACERKPQGC